MEFEFFGYHGINNGRYQIDGVWHDNGGKSFYDLEHFQDYVNCGLNIMFLQACEYGYDFIVDNGYIKDASAVMQFYTDKESDYQDSLLKQLLDLAKQAGAEKTLFMDARLYWLSSRTHSLIGNEFQSEKELDTFVSECVKDYSTHDVFWGLLLRDEPTWDMFEASGQVYRSLKRVCEKVQPVQNLLPIYGTGTAGSGNLYVESLLKEDGTEKTRKEFYLEYLTNWQAATGADYIMMDTYPFKAIGIQEYHTNGLKYTAEFCKEKNLELWVVAQSASWSNSGGEQAVSNRAQTKEDMYWQLNMLMGFGVNKVMYYTYFRRAGGNSTTGGFYHDNVSFVNSSGEKTELYYFTQDIMAEMQKFAGTILNFRYQGSAVFMKAPMNFICSHAYSEGENDTFTAIKNVSVDVSNMAMVNELYDSERDNYMYMVLNSLDPVNTKKGDTSLTVEIEFQDKYEYVAVYYKGEVTYEKLKGHKYSCVLSAGYAKFLLPY